jgi:hypothetical protein
MWVGRVVISLCPCAIELAAQGFEGRKIGAIAPHTACLLQ